MTEDLIANFTKRYSRPQTRAELAVYRHVCGTEEGVYSYATAAQADALAQHLELRPDLRLLDVGAGRGWPGLRLARLIGCETFITDVAPTGLSDAMSRAVRTGIAARVSFVRANATDLPFRSRAFDAVVHTDVL